MPIEQESRGSLTGLLLLPVFCEQCSEFFPSGAFEFAGDMSDAKFTFENVSEPCPKCGKPCRHKDVANASAEAVLADVLELGLTEAQIARFGEVATAVAEGRKSLAEARAEIDEAIPNGGTIWDRWFASETVKAAAVAGMLVAASSLLNTCVEVGGKIYMQSVEIDAKAGTTQAADSGDGIADAVPQIEDDTAPGVQRQRSRMSKVRRRRGRAKEKRRNRRAVRLG